MQGPPTATAGGGESRAESDQVPAGGGSAVRSALARKGMAERLPVGGTGARLFRVLLVAASS